MYKISNSNDSTSILLYSLIEGGITASKLLKSLDGLDYEAPITLRINSDGGEVFDAIALYNTFKGRNLSVIIDGMCASAASIVAMAGKHILMKRGSMLMIHNPITNIRGDSEALKDAASVMDKLTDSLAEIYSQRTKLDKSQILSLMDSETYLTPDEALRMGFIDEVEAEDSPAAPSYEDGIKAERERLQALDDLMAPGREEIIARAKYSTGASAKDIAIELLKAEAARIPTPPPDPAPAPVLNSLPVPDRNEQAIAAFTETIQRKRG